MRPLTVLSLFDGISTGRLALDMAGVEIGAYISSEVDAAPIAISENRWQEIVRVGDVRNVKAKNLPPVDLVMGGSPCQGFSRAGHHLNFDDPRSALFFEFARVVAEVKARNRAAMFVLENVAMRKEWENAITETMGVTPIHINSRLVSAQNRPRVYWTDIPGADRPQDRGIKLVDILERDVDASAFIHVGGLLFDPSISEAARSMVSVVGGEVRIRQATKVGYIVAEDGDGVNLAFPTSATRRGRVIKGKSNTMDCACEGCVYHGGIIRRFTLTELERLQTLPDGYTGGGY